MCVPITKQKFSNPTGKKSQYFPNNEQKIDVPEKTTTNMTTKQNTQQKNRVVN